jgi:hypothetical protein
MQLRRWRSYQILGCASSSTRALMKDRPSTRGAALKRLDSVMRTNLGRRMPAKPIDGAAVPGASRWQHANSVVSRALCAPRIAAESFDQTTASQPNSRARRNLPTDPKKEGRSPAQESDRWTVQRGYNLLFEKGSVRRPAPDGRPLVQSCTWPVRAEDPFATAVKISEDGKGPLSWERISAGFRHICGVFDFRDHVTRLANDRDLINRCKAFARVLARPGIGSRVRVRP